MLNEQFLLFLLVYHFFADFVLQTDDQAKLKSTNIYHLACHVLTYSIAWFFGIWFYTGDPVFAIWFSIITYGFHYVTDWCTSRLGKTYWDKGDYHNGFIIVGFDQILHYIQLYFTFKIGVGLL